MKFMFCLKINPNLSIIIYLTILPIMLLIKDSLLLWQVVRKQETFEVFEVNLVLIAMQLF